MLINPSNAAQPLGSPGPAARVDLAAHKHRYREEANGSGSIVRPICLSVCVCECCLSAGRGIFYIVVE